MPKTSVMKIEMLIVSWNAGTNAFQLSNTPKSVASTTATALPTTARATSSAITTSQQSHGFSLRNRTGATHGMTTAHIELIVVETTNPGHAPVRISSGDRKSTRLNSS